MGPNKNMQGGISFFSLTTGRIIDKSGTDFTPLPMPQDAIDRVAYMARNTPPGLTFTGYYNDRYASDSDSGDDNDTTIVTDHSDSDIFI